jgi:hypothetical protein
MGSGLSASRIGWPDDMAQTVPGEKRASAPAVGGATTIVSLGDIAGFVAGQRSPAAQIATSWPFPLARLTSPSDQGKGRTSGR